MIELNKAESVSVHDATPKFHNSLAAIFAQLANVPTKKKSIAIVPFWEYQWDIREFPQFIRLMKRQEKKGWELAIHGYTHSHPQKYPWYHIFFNSTAGWEFYSLNYEETAERIKRGVNIFKEAFGQAPRGFIPPNWHISDQGYAAVRDMGFDYITSLRHIKWFNQPWEKRWIYDKKFSSHNVLNPLARAVLGMLSRKKRFIIHPK